MPLIGCSSNHMAGCHTQDWFKEASPKKSWLTPIEKVETIQICWQWKESISMTSFIKDLCLREPVRFTNDVIFHVTTVNFSPLKTLPKNVALFMDIGETIIATGGFWGTQTPLCIQEIPNLGGMMPCFLSHLARLLVAFYNRYALLYSYHIWKPMIRKVISLSRPVFWDDASLA